MQYWFPYYLFAGECFITVDSAIHWINLYPLNNAIGFPNTYPLDSVIQREHYPKFEQPDPVVKPVANWLLKF